MTEGRNSNNVLYSSLAQAYPPRLSHATARALIRSADRLQSAACYLMRHRCQAHTSGIWVLLLDASCFECVSPSGLTLRTAAACEHRTPCGLHIDVKTKLDSSLSL